MLTLGRGGLRDGSDVHVGFVLVKLRRGSMRIAKVMKRIDWGAL